MAVAVVLYGPKAAGKSRVAEVLRVHHNVAHVDADAIVLALLAADVRPHPAPLAILLTTPAATPGPLGTDAADDGEEGSS